MLILMAVKNGARYLPAQLGSLTEPLRAGWRLRLSDDGSEDGSPGLLRRFAARWPQGQVQIGAGPGQGAAAHFLALLADLPEVPGPVALADQDDIWLPGKLARAQALLSRVPGHVPAFVHARRVNWDVSGGLYWPSAHPARPPCFENALLENVAFGNTLVLNPAAARLVRQVAPQAAGIYAHDWFLYQLLTGAGALCLYDPVPAVLYRLHGGNAIGCSRGLRGWLARKRAVLRGRYARRIDAQLTALLACRAALTPENRTTLEAFAAARRAPGLRRLGTFRKLGLFRQTRQGRLGFWGGALLGLV
ncbi:glycosyl transferase [Pseudooceanicola sp. CBS1P-1]|uniref:Glycosyl transferase n=2 Tax=Paracoccaceae TaxID=31989 RepID=A0A6L7G8J4_9RHOB|nr:glycosyl transferase [Pseudooceanicola endophyticus]MXN20401.1 glycosyl transferase [Pseudooceanicola albus]